MCAQNYSSKNELGENIFGHYEAYPFPFQIVGIFLVVLVFIIFLVGLKRPDLFQKVAALDEQPMWSNSKDKESGVANVYLEMS